MLFGVSKVPGTLHLVDKHNRKRVIANPLKPAAIDVYIARPSVLENTYHIGVDGTRDEVCDKYDVRLRKKVKRQDPAVMEKLQFICDKLDDGHDVYLVCFCAPKRCHGLSVIKQVERLRKRKAKE